jgi:UPF0755 protein
MNAGRRAGSRGRAGPSIIAILLVLVIAAAALAAGAALYARNLYLQAGPATADGAPRTVMIEPGSGVQRIATALETAGAVPDAFAFRMAVRATGTGPRLKAGEYAIPSGASLKDIIDQLVEGRAVLHALTIPEGLTSAMILRLVEASDVLEGPMPESAPAEGVLLPDTYMFQRGETRQQMISRMIKAQQELMAELWPRRQPGLPIETQEEAIILASIVEKETGLAEERPMVASVFTNRLRKGMRLESDPTIIYGLTKGEPLGRGLLRSEMLRENAWNTYQIDRLPPTPISNPGRASIEAVLDPPVSDALFFVADGSGGHAFAATYAEHLRNVAKWREIEAAARASAAASP